MLAALTVSGLGVWRPLGLIGAARRPLTYLWFLPFVLFGLVPLT